MARITIDDVARVAKVSKSTVSRVMNGRYQHVSIETRERVEAVIERLGYRRNELAASLKTRRTRTIGMVVPSILNPFYTAVVRGAEDELRQHECNLVICNADEDSPREAEYVESLLRKGCDGFLIATGGGNEEFYEQLYEDSVPIVCIDRYIHGVPYDAAIVDNYEQSCRVTQYLLELGHRDILFYCHSPEHLTVRAERLAGFRKAYEIKGIPLRPEHIVFVPPRPREEAYQHLRDILASPARPTALFTQSAVLTSQGLAAIRDSGLAIPDDISLTGFDDLSLSMYVDPPLSLVQQPTYELGAQAAQQLLWRMKQKTPGKGRRIVLKTEFVRRASCAPPPQQVLPAPTLSGGPSLDHALACGNGAN